MAHAFDSSTWEQRQVDDICEFKACLVHMTPKGTLYSSHWFSGVEDRAEQYHKPWVDPGMRLVLQLPQQTHGKKNNNKTQHVQPWAQPGPQASSEVRLPVGKSHSGDSLGVCMCQTLVCWRIISPFSGSSHGIGIILEGIAIKRCFCPVTIDMKEMWV